VVERLRMLIKYDGTELDAAIINAIFGAYIESPFDPQMVEMALSDGEHLPRYQQERSEFHNERKTVLGSARLPILFPGEKINVVNAARPSGNFEGFEAAVLRNVASATGMSAQQISQNWGDVNYSSARGALMEAWKTFDRRRWDFGVGFGQPIYTNVVEEIHEKRRLPLPKGAPPFNQYRGAYAKARWIGPGRGWIDPVKEPQGSVMKMDAGLSTLEEEVDANEGGDWRDKIEQRAVEINRFNELGIPVPAWGSGQPANEATKEEQPQ
jgi:lambda family phage portal protein